MLTAQIETLRERYASVGEVHTPELTAGACLNAHHRGAACGDCADICPAEAIAISQGMPHLATDRCVGCGLCLATCPVGAWRADAPEAKLVATAAGLPDTQLAVICALHPQPARPAAPDMRVLRHRRCLAALHLADMLALCAGSRRPVWLDDTPCAACPLQAAAVLQTRVGAANDLLAAYGHAVRLQLASIGGVAPSGRSLPVVDGGQPRLSRRRLFATLRGSRSAAETSPDSPRQRLLAALPPAEDAAAVVLPPTAPFGRVGVDPVTCSGCGLCAHFCPTGALTWSVTEPDGADGRPAFALSFAASACVACPICTLACPEHAVRLTHSITAAMLADASPPARLVTGRLVACRDCGALTAETPGEARCHVCRHRAGPVTPLHDGAGLMADLLKRSASLVPE